MKKEGLCGFVGLGKMGRPMAENLSLKVQQLRVFDIAGTKERTPGTAHSCSSFEELAEECSIIFLSLPDACVVTGLVETLIGLKNAVCRTLVDTSTIGVRASKNLERKLESSGICYLDCPVSGGQEGARKGTLTFMCSGSEDHFLEIRELLQSMAGNIFYTGPSCGQGQAMKLLNNFLSGTAMLATSEAYGFGRHHGLDPGQIFEVLNVSTGVNSATLDKFPKQIVTGQYSAGFSNTMMSKDVSLFRKEILEAKTPAPLSEFIEGSWRRFAEEQPDADFTRIFLHIGNAD